MLDVPIRQVLVEARIVIANSSFGEEIGVEWGVGANRFTDDSQMNFGSSIEDVTSTSINNTNEINDFSKCFSGKCL